MRRRNRSPAPGEAPGEPFTEITLERPHSVELAFLTIASAYSLTLPRKRTITLVDAAVLVGLFVALMNLSISVREAGMLFALFWAQFVLGAVVPESWHGAERVAVGILYMVLAAFLLLRQRREVPGLMRDGLRTNYAELTRQA